MNSGVHSPSSDSAAPGLAVQAWTIREALAEDAAAACARLAEIGYSQIELFGVTDRLDELVAATTGAGLSVPSIHAGLLSLPDDAAVAEVFAAAQALGAGTVIDPFYRKDIWTDADAVAAAAERLNQIAALGAGNGLQIGYHNHDFELSSKLGDRPALEVFAEQLDPQVALEVDTYWAQVGGVDAPELLRRLGTRVKLIHAKDGDLSLDNTAQTALGHGRMDVPAVAAAVAELGSVHTVVVELDDTSGDIWQAVTDSLPYARQTFGIAPAAGSAAAVGGAE